MKCRTLLSAVFGLPIHSAARSLLGFPMTAETSIKTRVVIQTDAEIDDQNSLCRLLLYSNEIDILGIFFNTTGGGAYEEWAIDRIKAYGEIRENLCAHASGWPTAEYFLERTQRCDAPDSVEKTMAILLDDDPRPVWYLIWGPGSEELLIGDVMRAVKELPEEQQEKVCRKIRIYSIWSQGLTPGAGGNGTGSWFPGKIQIINSNDQFKAIAYRNDWKNTVDPEDGPYISDPFQIEHFESHGPLSAWYNGPTRGKPQTLEGDSPSFLHTLPVGLRSLEHPSYGGWGGRFQGPSVDGMHWIEAPDTDATNFESRLFKPISRWFSGMQNDYAARCDWAKTPIYSEANHQPVAKLDHPEDLDAVAGEVISLSSFGSHDPDGDELSFKWWRYKDADTYKGDIMINSPLDKKASFTFPEDAKGKTIHIILEVSDNGAPSLTRYRRVIVTGK